MTYGATAEEWDHFDLILGLTEDLLPVVSNPNGKIAATSKLKALGKTPSVYNRSRLVVGISDWTSKRSTSKDIQRWAKEKDYGVFVQTRTVRGIDVDIPDPDRASLVCGFIDRRVRGLPRRQRVDTGKFLAAFAMPGEFPKRTLTVEGGVIEFLGTGNGFSALGAHIDKDGVSRSRYEWEGGLPYEIPTLEVEEFEALWSALVDEFGIQAPTSVALSVRQREERIDLPDPVVDYLRERDLVLGEQRDGSLILACPWEREHTTGERGNGSTVWFPAGTNGYPKGHFKCLHAHCAGRQNADYWAQIGYVEDVAGDFDLVEVKGEPKAWPSLQRQQNGAILAIVENLAKMLRRPDICGMDIRHDRFKDEIVWSPEGRAEWRPFLDQHYVELRIRMEHIGFKPIGRELIRDVVHLVATENSFDTAIEWLEGLTWDGTPRIETFLERYFGADPSEYARAVSLYVWTALAGRALRPGIKVDMALILIGPQGIKKSTGIAAMSPAEEFFVEMSFHEKDDDLSRKMRGTLIAEIAELRGLHTRELETIKAFMTRTHETWTPKYREFKVSFPRRLVFIGTTNQTQFLADSTGNRRWLPVRVSNVDVDAIRRDRLQLWAEAREWFNLSGVHWEAAELLACEVHEEHTIEDAWADPITSWLNAPDTLTGEIPRTRKFLRVGEVMQGALRIDAKNAGRFEQMRVGTIMRALNYDRRRMRVDGDLAWVYVPTGGGNT